MKVWRPWYKKNHRLSLVSRIAQKVQPEALCVWCYSTRSKPNVGNLCWYLKITHLKKTQKQNVRGYLWQWFKTFGRSPDEVNNSPQNVKTPVVFFAVRNLPYFEKLWPWARCDVVCHVWVLHHLCVLTRLKRWKIQEMPVGGQLWCCLSRVSTSPSFLFSHTNSFLDISIFRTKFINTHKTTAGKLR